MSLRNHMFLWSWPHQISEKIWISTSVRCFIKKNIRDPCLNKKYLNLKHAPKTHQTNSPKHIKKNPNPKHSWIRPMASVAQGVPRYGNNGSDTRTHTHTRNTHTHKHTRTHTHAHWEKGTLWVRPEKPQWAAKNERDNNCLLRIRRHTTDNAAA